MGSREADQHGAPDAVPYATHRYGPQPDHYGHLRLPQDGDGPHPVVALLHGGGWRDAWGLDALDGIAVDLARRGYATWNLEFRRLGSTRWPAWHTLLDDVSAGIEHLRPLAGAFPLDLGRVVVLGHSSGGHLALWAAARDRLPPGAPGAAPAVHPVLVLSLAGLGELEEFAERGLDAGSAAALLGGLPADVPERYAVASPRRLLPLGVPQLLVHGEDEAFVALNDLGRVYERAARDAGDDVRYVELPSAGHFDLVDPRGDAWRSVAERLQERVPVERAGCALPGASPPGSVASPIHLGRHGRGEGAPVGGGGLPDAAPRRAGEE